MEKKRILITGKGSYVGTSFINWVKQWPEQYEVEELSVRGEAWKEYDFSIYDVVLHVAGIAHVSTDPSMEQEYYRVNRDLTIEVARKAKQDGVRQFIFMSSIIVYGDSGQVKVIDRNTIPKPSNFYGESKLQAEKKVMTLGSEGFKVVILRPPMIYGRASRGNYQLLASFTRKFPVFPNINNKRSMLHIDNLCEFIRFMIVNKEQGLFFPQNIEYVNTSQMVISIAQVHGKKIILTKAFNLLLLNKLARKVSVINKLFGDLAYELAISEYKDNYQIRNFIESIHLTETIDKEG
ncbi:putative NAD-dependent epimerase/dehydratase [Paenibacillus sp. FSL R7-269]|uniref:NAD-dependent epimerase/dehydratase family protein n=1 Tax=Paenibacillus sp. FSL R7-269 TaxID=1226755 RepID=UPI0003E26918|nr:NAD-dependent epimerase/dehydratase family protein [Paenibacillus sp. FSL R7-269]ETT45164.1 putative NAD-dependent epimerase/dehydratase [Paenibacillus sp. FSL R7-269]